MRRAGSPQATWPLPFILQYNCMKFSTKMICPRGGRHRESTRGRRARGRDVRALVNLGCAALLHRC
jgi:hypothetical protein